MRSKVLFVDDDAATRDVVGWVLAERGFEIVCRSDGAEAMVTLAEAVALTEVDRITVDDLPEKIRTYRSDMFVLPTRRSYRAPVDGRGGEAIRPQGAANGKR